MNERLFVAMLFGFVGLLSGPVHCAQPDQPRFQAPRVLLSPSDQKLYDEAMKLAKAPSELRPNPLLQAEEIFQTLVKNNPKSGQALAGLAVARFHLAAGEGRALQDVFALAQRAALMDPNAVDAHIVLGLIYVEQKNMNASQRAADRALAIDPDKPDVMYIQARVLQLKQEYAAAEQWFRRAIDAQPLPHRKSNLYYWLATMLSEKKPADRVGAHAAFQKMVELDPDSPPKLNSAGVFFFSHTDRYDLAVECLQRAYQSDSNFEHRENLGLALYYRWGHATMNSALYKTAKMKVEQPREITQRTGVTPEVAFAMNPIGSSPPWATLSMLKFGMVKNIDVVPPNSYSTALVAAAYGNHFELVKELVGRNANVNSEDKDFRRTALSYAVKNRNFEMVRFLVERGARINIVDGSKKPLLALVLESTESNDLRILHYLLDRGADPTVTDERGMSLLGKAVENSNAPALRLFIEKYRLDPNATTSSGTPFLAFAAASSGPSHELVSLLLEKGANPWVMYGTEDILAVLSRPSMRLEDFSSKQKNFDLISEARRRVPKPENFGTPQVLR